MTTQMDRPSLIKLPNGERAIPTFTPAEMDRRLKGLRNLMSELSLDASLFTSFHNINYYADYLYCYFGRNYGLVVTPGEQVSISANIDYGLAHRRTYGSNIVYTDWQRDNYFKAVREVVPRNAKRVGIEFDHVSLTIRAKLQAALPGVELVDIAPQTMMLSLIHI